MKKKTQKKLTVGEIPKLNRNIVETEVKLIP